jgi:predicted Zn-dependent protease
VKILVRAGIDPTKFPEFFRRMAKDEGTLDKALAIVSTHPSHKERDERLKALFEANKSMTVKPLGVDWKKLQEALSATAKLGKKEEKEESPGGK